MNNAYQLDIIDTNITAFSDNLEALKKLAESADMDHEGKLGLQITDTETGEVVFFQKRGLDCTLSDLAEMEYPSPSLYAHVLKNIKEITGLETEDALHQVTMRDIREMVLGGSFVSTRGTSAKTRMEFYEMLIAYCGNTRVTRLAINQNIELHERDWVLQHPKDLLTHRDPTAATYWADLNEEYYKRYPL